MTPSRRKVLLLSGGTAASLLAGCMNSESDSEDSPTGSVNSPTKSNSPSATESPTATPLPDERVEWPEGPKERPPIPESLSHDTVRGFVYTHEKRYMYNLLWVNERSEIDLITSTAGVLEFRGGFKAWTESTGTVRTRGVSPTDSTATATYTSIGDITKLPVVYYVDQDSVLRWRQYETPSDWD